MSPANLFIVLFGSFFPTSHSRFNYSCLSTCTAIEMLKQYYLVTIDELRHARVIENIMLRTKSRHQTPVSIASGHVHVSISAHKPQVSPLTIASPFTASTSIRKGHTEQKVHLKQTAKQHMELWSGGEILKSFLHMPKCLSAGTGHSQGYFLGLPRISHFWISELWVITMEIVAHNPHSQSKPWWIGSKDTSSPASFFTMGKPDISTAEGCKQDMVSKCWTQPNVLDVQAATEPIDSFKLSWLVSSNHYNKLLQWEGVLLYLHIRFHHFCKSSQVRALIYEAEELLLWNSTASLMYKIL